MSPRIYPPEDYLEYYHIAEDKIKDLLKDIGLGNLDEIIKEHVEELKKEVSESIAYILLKLLEFLVGIFAKSFSVIGYVTGQIASYKKFGEYQANEELRPALIEISDSVDAWLKDIISEETLNLELSRHGLSDTRIDILKRLTRRYLTIDTLIDLYNREIVTIDNVYDTGKKLGYTREDVDLQIEAKKQLLSTAEILELVRRNYLTYTEANQELSKLGYDEETRRKLLLLYPRLIDADYYIRSWLREEITETELNDRLLGLGLTGNDIDVLKRLAFYVPPPADLIRMAVRECFTPEIAERYGQYQDFPEDFKKYAKWQGISEEWAKAYWAAHWELPSLTMGYEMLHRGVITKEELETLMRAQDVMPFWRDKLIQISYNPFTRVDVRRMFALGVLNRDEVKKTYMDLGYDEWHAEKLTQFTEQSIIEEERDLTKSEIVTAYKDSIIDRDEAIKHLQALNYSEQAIAVIIALADYQKEKELRDTKIDAIKNKFLNETIDKNEAIRQLTMLALPAAEISNYIEKWELQKKTKATELDLTSLKNAYRLGFISRDNFIERLKKKGYNITDAEIIVKLTDRGK